MTRKGCIYNTKYTDDGFVEQEFLPPEQLKNSIAGVTSDIYSFCAIIKYLLPEELTYIDNAKYDIWYSIVEKGLHKDIKRRPTIMS